MTRKPFQYLARLAPFFLAHHVLAAEPAYHPESDGRQWLPIEQAQPLNLSPEMLTPKMRFNRPLRDDATLPVYRREISKEYDEVSQTLYIHYADGSTGIQRKTDPSVTGYSVHRAPDGTVTFGHGHFWKTQNGLHPHPGTQQK